MKIITCASYYGSGSSAVSDLLSEYSVVKSLTDYEFRFVQDPDGISELEYNLVENFNRHNSGHALKRYKRLVDYYGDHLLYKRYEPFFQNHWKEYSYRYIDELTDFSYPGSWMYDSYDKGKLYDFLFRLPNGIMKRTIWRNSRDRNLKIGNEITLASHPTEEKFLTCTKRYIRSLMEAANPENKPFLMVDQILPSTNIARHMRYFDDIRVIIVDRDPRDIYLQGKYFWHDSIVPTDAEAFCKWYRYARSTQNEEILDKQRVLLIQFEDLIYNYKETVRKITQWLGIDESLHTGKFNSFDPSKSIENTGFWISHAEYKNDADQIAERLPECLYEFPKIN